MLSWVTAIAGRALEAFFGLSGSISNTDVKDALVPIWGTFKALVGFLQSLFGSELGAWQFAHPHIVGGAWGIGELAGNELEAWHLLFENIIPNSLQWLDGHTHQWVDAKYDPIIRVFNEDINAIFKWEVLVGNYINGFLTPHVKAWIGFRTWFDTWPQSVVFTVKSWLDDPWKFANWSIPYVSPLVVDWLGVPHNAGILGQLTQYVVDATPSQMFHVEQAICSVLLTDVGETW